MMDIYLRAGEKGIVSTKTTEDIRSYQEAKPIGMIPTIEEMGLFRDIRAAQAIVKERQTTYSFKKYQRLIACISYE